MASALTTNLVTPLTTLSASSGSPASGRQSTRQRVSFAHPLSHAVHGSHASSLSGQKLKLTAAVSRTHQRRTSTVISGLFGLGVPELVVIAGVAAVLFGPKQLPEVGKNLGKTVKSFQQAAKEFETELKTNAAAATEELKSGLENATEEVKSTADSVKKEVEKVEKKE